MAPAAFAKQYRQKVIQYHSLQGADVIEYLGQRAQSACMKQIVLTALTLGILSVAQPTYAQCYADYKAKQDNPLRLHYGVVQLQGACQVSAAQTEIAQRIARAGWTLLNVMSVFGPEGLNERKDSAGPYFLRF